MSLLTDPLAMLWQKLGSRPYDMLYRRGAPWEGAPRAELVSLLASGQLNVATTGGPRALDVGCGSGADSILLADHGYEVIGVDFSEVALAKARATAGPRQVRFIRADLFDLPEEITERPFDLIFDGGTLDDFPAPRRRELAQTLTDIARPGSVLVMWCFCAEPGDLPWVSLRGPSRLLGTALPPAEVFALFEASWEVQRLPEPGPPDPFGCFWMVRR